MNANNEEILKPEVKWTIVEIAAANLNSITLNMIGGRLEEDHFTLIALYMEAKKAWDILEALYEGDFSVKQSKMQ